jgi:hypothetical protein
MSAACAYKSCRDAAQLLRLVNELGQGNWTLIAKQLSGRMPKQCRQRYLNKVSLGHDLLSLDSNLDASKQRA